MQDLSDKKCIPCSVAMPPMKEQKVREMLSWLNSWELLENSKKIRKQFKFKNFVQSMEFVNKVAEISEEQGHHPDIFISYNIVDLTLCTHKIKGLHENDFILASKIDKI